MVSISSSVGYKGVNKRTDTETIQRQINKFIGQLSPLKPLVTDGVVGSLTIGAITEFQKRIVGFANPDGRVDPGGQTLAALCKPPGTGNTIGDLWPPTCWPGLPGAPGNPHAPGPGNGGGGGGGGGGNKAPKIPKGRVGNAEVIFGDKLPQSDKTIVNAYSLKVIAMCFNNAGVKKAVITSTIRSLTEQIDIMYRNAKKNLADQYELYGSAGDKVLKVFEKNRDKPEAEVKKLMIAEAERLAKLGQRISLHVVPESVYRKRNIIDIGVNSTKAANGGNVSVSAIMKAFRNAETDGYIAKFIDETTKSNTCWHVEIVPNAKPVPG